MSSKLKTISFLILSLLVFQPFALASAQESTTIIYPSKYYNIDSNGKVTKHIFANGIEIAVIEGTGTDAKVKYIHTDNLGGTNVVTDSNGVVVETIDYFPFGSIRLDEKTSFSEQRKYIGQEYDEATKLNYLNARYYDSERGQFLSQDPVFLDPQGQSKEIFTEFLTNPQSQNSYSYAKNNPITLSDPKGEFTGLNINPFTAAILYLFYPQETSFDPIYEPEQYAKQNNPTQQISNMTFASLMPGGKGKANNFTVKYGEELGFKMNFIVDNTKKSGLNLNDHAVWRMAIRDITPKQVVQTIKNNNPIEYFHEGVLKNGFRDPISKIFVGQVKDSGRITTVINNTSSNYLSNLVNKGLDILSKLKK